MVDDVTKSTRGAMRITTGSRLEFSVRRTARYSSLPFLLAYLSGRSSGTHGTFVVGHRFDESMARKRGRTIVKQIEEA